MNTLVIVLIAAVLLSCAYVFYGRWLANKWGIDPKAETPAKKFEDGKDYVPTDGWTVFSHQFSSIAGAGPVTGAIQAAVFGWVPVFLWIIVGGIFFGAVTDFGALYASVKNEGKSMGLLIEKYIGKFGRKVFLLFCWLFTLLVIAAFADMVAGTFNAYTEVDGVVKLADAAKTNGAAGTISLLFIVFAMIFGLVQKKFRFHGWKETVVGLVFTVAALGLGMLVPITATKDTWTYITFVYIFFTAVLPMWILKQPRDTMTTYMFIGMIAGAALGLLVAHPTMNLPVFTGFHNDTLGDMFPILFVTVACGAVSGFHSLVSSGTSSKTVSNEKDMLKVGYGAMVLESLLARTGEAYLAGAGGCRIGKRPTDLHQRAMELLGAEVFEEDGTIRAKADHPKGAVLCFPKKSVGATENAVLFAVGAEGATRLEHCAREPEVVHLCRFLKAMGAEITGEGTEQITVYGRERDCCPAAGIVFRVTGSRQGRIF